MDRCLRCESLLGSEHHWDALLYPDGDGVTDAPWECEVEYKSLLQTPSNTYSFHLMDPSPALFTPSLKYFTQVIYKMRRVCEWLCSVCLYTGIVCAWMCVCVQLCVFQCSLSVVVHAPAHKCVYRQVCMRLWLWAVMHTPVHPCEYACLYACMFYSNNLPVPVYSCVFVCVWWKEKGPDWMCICVCNWHKAISDKVKVGLLLPLEL